MEPENLIETTIVTTVIETPRESPPTVEISADETVILEISGQDPDRIVATDLITEIITVGIPGPPGPRGPTGPPGTGTDIVLEDYPAGEDLGGQRVVIVHTDGELYYADQSNPAHFNRVLGITTVASVTGEYPGVRVGGVMNEPTWAWDLSKFIYLGTNGLFVQNQPASGFLLQLGWPITATSMMVDIKLPILLN